MCSHCGWDEAMDEPYTDGPKADVPTQPAGLRGGSPTRRVGPPINREAKHRFWRSHGPQPQRLSHGLLGFLGFVLLTAAMTALILLLLSAA